MKEIMVCQHCGSKNVHRKFWAEVNGIGIDPTDDYWCINCDNETKIVPKSRFEKEIIKRYVIDYLKTYTDECASVAAGDGINWIDQHGIGYLTKEEETILTAISECKHPLTELADRYAQFCAFWLCKH